MTGRGLLAGVLIAIRLTPAVAQAAAPMLPRTTRPIIYTINYSGEYFTRPDYIEQFKAAPPDLLHMGKAVPISHLWGPIRLYQGENQYTGGPNHTLSQENIALLSTDDLARRVETIRSTLRRYHALGIPEIVPYISYHTLAGDHEKRKGFWAFYDRWDAYAKWAGPKPPRDPFEWLAVDAKGAFLPGSCGGYSPDYFAPLHRYRACINHPDWAEWHRRLIRMIAEVGYDGCFVDNAHPDPCFCRYCRAGFRAFLDERRDVAWVQRLAMGLDLERLTLDSPEAPSELIRRWRVLRTGDHLGRLRQAGRAVKPGFTIFPNSGRIDECLQVGGQCDRLMFESTFSPGIQVVDDPPESEDVLIRVGDDALPQAPPVTRRYELYDPTTWMEMVADITIPSRVGTRYSSPFVVRIISVGASLRDEDAAEDFHLVFSGVRTGRAVRLDLAPRCAIGGTGSSRKPRQPPVELSATWRLPEDHGGETAYTVAFGFRYTDDSHRETTRRPRLDGLTWGKVCRSHQAELLFTQHMHARPIYLGYEAARKGRENVQELALAEMAAFSGGGGFAARGEPQAKYRAFLHRHAELFDGWEPAADAAVLYACWGPNTLHTQRPWPARTVADWLGETHRLFVVLTDGALGEARPGAPQGPGILGRFRVLYLASSSYELTEGQSRALDSFFAGGGRVVLVDPQTTINGAPAAQVLRRRLVVAVDALPGQREIERGPTVWDPRLAAREARLATTQEKAAWGDMAPTHPIAPDDGLRRNIRFALYRKGDRLALHVVNYNVCLLDPARKVLRVEPTDVTVPVPGGWAAGEATCIDPDAGQKALACTVREGSARFTLPRLRTYTIVVLEKKP